MIFLSKCFSNEKSILILIILLTITSSEEEEDDEEPIFCDGIAFEENHTSSTFRSSEDTIKYNLDEYKIPKKFDSREQWPNCISIKNIYHQGKCGGCWAFASTAVMSDRLCIASKGHYNQLLSVEDLLECCKPCVRPGIKFKGGCRGGFIKKSFDFWKTGGVSTENCKPLENDIIKGKPSKQCRNFCPKIQNNMQSKMQYSKTKSYSVKVLKSGTEAVDDLRHLQVEIMVNGPLVAGINAYRYIHKVPPNAILQYNAEQAGDDPGIRHAVKIIGWDEINGVPVWIMANSWGRKWCNKGFCYIRRGKNDFDLETKRMIAGIPKVFIKSEKSKKMNSGSGLVQNFENIYTLMIIIVFYLIV